jgi:hypothetical protein
MESREFIEGVLKPVILYRYYILFLFNLISIQSMILYFISIQHHNHFYNYVIHRDHCEVNACVYVRSCSKLILLQKCEQKTANR